MPENFDILHEAFELSRSGGMYFEGERVKSFSKHLYLFVGLGGTGTDALIRVKNQVHNRMQLPHKNGSIAPTSDVPENMAFLAVDTNVGVKNAHYGNTRFAADGSETLAIGASQTTSWQVILDEIKDDKKANMEYAQWINLRAQATGGSDGAGGKRMIGRVGVFHNYSRIRNTVDRILTKLSQDNDSSAKLKIFVFTGISGGTGSGSFIDMGYILREIGRNHNPSCDVYGYMFFPDVNLLKGGQEDLLKSTAFGALKELDYLSENGEVRGRSFVQKYDNTSNPVNGTSPYSYVHLINATDDNGGAHTHDDLMNSVAESVFSFVADEPNLGEATEPGFQELYDNISADFGICAAAARFPAYDRYISIGAELKKIPYMEINTLVACRMFERLKASVFANEVTADKFDADSAKLGLGSEIGGIEDALTGILESNRPPMRSLTTRDFDYGSIWDGKDLAYDRAYKDWGDYQRAVSDAFGASKNQLEGNLKRYLKNSFVDPERGPFYLANIIKGSNERTMLSRFVEAEQRFRAICNQQIEERKKLESRMRDIRLEYESPSAWQLLHTGKKGMANEYLTALRAWRENQCVIDKYDYLSQLCEYLIEIYTKYYNNILAPMTQCLSELVSIFTSNLEFLKTKYLSDKKIDDPSIILIPFEFETDPYKNQFEQCVLKAKQEFLDSLLTDMNLWIKCDIDHVDDNSVVNTDIPGSLSRFVSDCFKTLYDKLHLNMETIFTPRIPNGGDIISYSETVIEDIYRRAYPLFKKSSSQVKTYVNGILSIPCNCPNIYLAAQRFKQNMSRTGECELILKQSAEVNCISVVKAKSGYALSNNADLSNLELYYEVSRAQPATGMYLHLDERWENVFPSPNVKPSWSGAYTCRRTELHNEKYSVMFNRCVKEGIIVKVQASKSALLHAADPDVDLKKIRLTGDLTAKNHQFGQLKGKIWFSPKSIQYDIEGMGMYRDNGTEEGQLDNIRENVIRDPELCKLIEEQCKIIEQLDKLHKSIEYPQVFVRALLCELLFLDKFEGIVYLKHLRDNDPMPFELLKDDGRGNIDPKMDTYYYNLYCAMYDVLSTHAGEGRTWEQQIMANWDAFSKSLRDEKKAIALQKQIIGNQTTKTVGFANIFQSISANYKTQAGETANVDEKQRLGEISDFYKSCFEALGSIYNRFFVQ